MEYRINSFETDANGLPRVGSSIETFRYGFSKGSDDTPDPPNTPPTPPVPRNFDDLPIVGDWSGNGFTSVGAAWPDSTSGAMRFRLDTDRDTQIEYAFRFGFNTDTPVVGNFDGSFGDDIAVVRNGTFPTPEPNKFYKEWYVTLAGDRQNGNAYSTIDATAPINYRFLFGLTGDRFLTGRFDSDALDDIVAIRLNSNGALEWRFHLTTNPATNAPIPFPSYSEATSQAQPPVRDNQVTFTFGTSGTPIVGDWNGDGIDDIGLIDSTGAIASWEIQTLKFDASQMGNTRLQPAGAKTSFPFGNIVQGQLNSFFVGTWGGNYWTGGGPALVNGPNPTGNIWSDPALWSQGRLPTVGETVVVDQPPAVQINFDQGNFVGNLITSNRLSVTGGRIELGTPSNLGDVEVSGGTLAATGDLKPSSYSQTGGVFEVSSSNPLGNVTMNVSGGTIRSTLQSAVVAQVVVANGFAITNTINFESVGNSYLVMSGPISGSGSVRKLGAGSLVFTSPNNYGGDTFIDNGELIAENANSLGGTTSGTQIAGNARLGLVTPGLVLEPITISSLGRLDLRRTVSYSGSLVLQAGSQVLLENGVALAGTTNVSGATSLSSVLNMAGSTSVTPPRIETIFQGVGALTLETLNGTPLEIRATTQNYTGNVTISGNGMLQQIAANGVPALATLNLGPNATLVLNSLDLSARSIAGNGQIDVSGAILFLDDGTFSGRIVGTGSLRKRNGGVLTLSGVSTFSGATAIEAGTLLIGGNNAIPATSDVTVSSGAIFDLSSNAQRVRSILGSGVVQGLPNSRLNVGDASNMEFAGRFLGGVSISKEGTGTLSVNGNSTNTGSWTVVGGTLRTVGDSILPDTASIDVQTGATFDASLSNDTINSINVNAGGTALLGSTAARIYQVLGGVNNRAGGTIQTGGSRLRVVGDFDNQGSFQSSGGVLEMAGNTALQNLRLGTSGLGTLHHSGSQRLLVQSSVPNVNLTGTIINDAGQMDISGLRVSAANLELNAGSLLGNNTSRITIASNMDVIAGYIAVSLAGNGRLRKTGAGTVDLTAVNSFTGEVTIVQGTLSTGISNTLPPTPVTVQTGATLLLNNNSQIISGLAGAGQVQLGTATVTVQALNPSSFDGLISGTGGVRKTGNGLWTLRSANSFSGGIEVFEGSLQAEGANSLSSGSVQVQSPGTLSIVGEQTITRLTNAGTLNLNTPALRFSGNFINSGILNPSNSTLETVGATDPQTVNLGAGIGGSILVSGQSTVQLNSASTNLTLNTVTVRGGSLETGAKQIAVQSLVMDSASATIRGTGSIDSATTFDLRAGAISIPLTGPAGLRKSTTGSIALTSASTYRGPTNVEQGVLSVQISGGLGGGAVEVGPSGTLRIVGTQPIASANINGSLEGTNATIQLSGNLENLGTLTAGTLETVRSDTNALRINLGNSTAVTNITTKGSSPVQLVSSTANITIPGTLLVGLGSVDVAGKNIAASQVILDGADATELKGTGSVTSSNTYDLRNGIVSIALNGTPALRKSTNGTVTLNVSNGFTGPTEIQSGTLRANASNSIGGAVSILTNASLNILANQKLASLENAGSLSANNSVMALAGNFISSGSFQAGASTIETVGTGNQRIDLGANQAHNLTASSSSTVQLDATASSITLTGTLSLTGGIVELGAKPTSTQAFVLQGNTNTILRGTRELTSASTYDVRGGVIAVGLAGSVGLRKSTSGTVRIDVPSTYQGRTDIVEGTLNANTTNAVSSQTPVRVEAGGTVNLNGFSTAMRSLSNGGNVSVGEAELSVANDLTNDAGATLDTGNGSIVLSGNLSNLGNWPSRGARLNWLGTATQQSFQSSGAAFASMNHSGNNSLVILDDAVVDGGFSQSGGNVQLSGGALKVGTLTWTGGQLSRSDVSSEVRIQDSATFQGGQIEAPVRGGNVWAKNGSGTLVFAAPINYEALLRIDDGSIEVGNGSALPDGRDLNVGASGNLLVKSGNASFGNISILGQLDIGGAILQIGPIDRPTLQTTALAEIKGTVVGSNGFIKRGATPLAWSGVNGISGTYQIAEGELQLLGDAALKSNSTLQIDSSGRVRLGRNSVSNQALIGEGELVLETGAVLQTQRGIFDGTLSGVGNIRKVGDGEWSLTSRSHGGFAGTIDVANGTLRFNGTISGANARVTRGSTLAGGGKLGSVEVTSGGILSPGNSPGTMQVQSLTLSAGSMLVIEMNGKEAATQYDQLVVNGLADFSGTVQVRMTNEVLKSLTPLDVFDLVKYSSVSGKPLLEVLGSDDSIRIVESLLPNSYRLNIEKPAPVVKIPVVGGPEDGPTDPGTPIDETKQMRFVSANLDEELPSFDGGPSESTDALVPELSNWLNESENMSPLISPPVTDEAIDIAALDSVLAEGLSLDLQMIASDAKPLTAEQMAEIPVPRFDSLSEAPKLPTWTEPKSDADYFTAKLIAVSGITTTLVGAISLGLGLMAIRRRGISRSKDTLDEILNKRFCTSGRGFIEDRSESADGTILRKDEAWTIE